MDGKTTTHLSSRTQKNTKYALRSLIAKLGLTDSDHVISDLRAEIEHDVEAKRRLERKLLTLANEEPLTVARIRMTYFKGVMRRGGGVHLNVTCDNHFQSEHKAKIRRSGMCSAHEQGVSRVGRWVEPSAPKMALIQQYDSMKSAF